MEVLIVGDDKLLTIDEVAEFLQLSKKAVRDLYRKKGLPVVRLGSNLIRFKQSDLDKFLNDRHVIYKVKE